jgi:hypothetical protein
MTFQKIEIDEKHLSRLCRIQATYKEMAAELECSEDTLSRRYADLIKRERERGKTALRAFQFKLMERYNSVDMAKWLGKEYLGQGKSENNTIDVTPLQELAHSLKALKPKDDTIQSSALEEEASSG